MAFTTDHGQLTTMQILPAIDLRNGRCVRLRQGDYAQETVFGDQPAEMAIRWADDGAPWLHLVDLDGAKAGQPVNVEAIRAIVQAVSVPCELGGGLRDDEAVRLMLDDVGIDRAIIGTQALKQPEWFRSLAKRYPGRIALGLDAKDGYVATGGWLDVSQKSAFELAVQFADLPLAAVIYTNIANDGMMQGIDPGTLDDLAKLCEAGLPVIASGGVTTLDDIHRLLDIHRRQPKLIGAIVGRAIYEGTIRVADAVALTSAQSDPDARSVRVTGRSDE
ncbi:MAG TPA: 1-(5-phosphoribosyl)-5-[(5-phosphoribosylamino)methylideneamino]imidazole-4-carboxamide isomerase [Planctomycetaceae bacterium]|nr:1-(5-phosphoribosyl)-5-[(5-phosphoribosylamino)methylideneamino]imidazole-4-carboxamide isomerase [Planctomycetaceae bacterium]